MAAPRASSKNCSGMNPITDLRLAAIKADIMALPKPAYSALTIDGPAMQAAAKKPVVAHD